MIMSDACTTHRSRVSRRRFGRIRGGAMTVEDERGPGLDLHLCFVCGSRPWGAAAFLLCSFIFIIKIFKCSPSSRIYELSYSNLLLWRISWKFSFAIRITWYFRNQSSLMVCCSRNISCYNQCWKQLWCSTMIHFFRMLEEQNVELEIFGNIINVFTVTYDQLNVPFLNKKYIFLNFFIQQDALDWSKVTAKTFILISLWCYCECHRVCFKSLVKWQVWCLLFIHGW